ncbi:MAG: hypothetical protein Q9M12_03205 [Mariprofundus sp.]|nr:hypothetical protein [Mariprofundus sp.]
MNEPVHEDMDKGQDQQKIVAAKKIATLVYALQAVSFLLTVTFIAAIIINYVKKDDVADTWVASHFRWQIRTFWFALLWACFGAVLFFLGIGYFILIGVAVWVIYRIAKGWLALADGKPMPFDS